jgi:hypothetical protein
METKNEKLIIKKKLTVQSQRSSKPTDGQKASRTIDHADVHPQSTLSVKLERLASIHLFSPERHLV